MMKRLFIPLLLLLLIPACKPDSGGQTAMISVSIEPFRYFVSAIAGDNYNINVIVPPGASPATYEPPPGVVKGISNSDLMLINGYLGFELAWIDRMENLNPDMKVLKLAESQDLISAGSHRHGSVIHYTGVDPHFWVSPKSARIMAKDIKDFLIRQDPESEEIYFTNYEKLDSIIRKTDDYLSSILGQAENRSFMVFHPSLSYLARDYGLEQIAVEIEGKEPSPSELKNLIDKARRNNISRIFIQREFNINNARLIAEEIGAKTVVIDPLSNDWERSVRDIAASIAGIK